MLKTRGMGGWHYKYSIPTAARKTAGAPAFSCKARPAPGSWIFSSPLGSQLALLHWSPHGAWLRQGSEETASDSLPALIERSLGTAVPIEAFFAWLQGRPLQAQGWHADLGQYTEGRISARRTDPLPQAQLKILLQPAP